MDWNDFATRLTIELMRLPVHSFLIVQAPGGLPYTQAMRSGDRTDAEAVGSAFLPRALSSRQERRLDALGWQRPDGRDHLNWWNRITMTDRAGNPAPGQAESCAELAGRMVGAFRDVYGIASPLELVYQASRNGAGGGPLPLPGLGIPVAIPDAQDEPVRSSRRSAKPVSLETALASARERGDQDEYLNLLARATLCLPSPIDPATVPEADHQYATARFGDGTFVLAFTSPEAMDRSLRGQAVHHRPTTLTRLARDWPHPQWQLAINPGLPSAAYLDAQSLLHPTEDEPQPRPAAQSEPRTANGRLTPTDVPSASVTPTADVEPVAAAPTVEVEPVAAAPTAAAPYSAATPSVAVAPPIAETASTFDASSPGAEPPADVAPPSAPPVFTQPDHEQLPLADTAPENQAPVAPKLDTWSDDTSTATSASASASGEGSSTAFDTSPGFSEPPAAEAKATPAFNAAPEPPAAFSPPGPEESEAVPASDAAAEPTTAVSMPASDEESYTAFDTSPEFGRPPADEPEATPAFNAAPEPPVAPAFPAAPPGPGQPQAIPSFDAVPDPTAALANPSSSPVVGQSQATPVFDSYGAPGASESGVPEAIPAFDTSAGNGVAGEPYLGVEAVVMQKVVRAEHVPHYLEGGYDRVAGYVHRLRDVQELNTPARLVRGLGLVYQDSPFSPGDDTIHVIRWAAVKPGLFRKPLGGIDEWSMGIIPGGWVIEKAPFPGSGYAPGDGTAVPEFKIDSQRLPHGAELYVLDRAGGETLVAGFDADRRQWVPRPIVEVPVRQPSADHTGGTAMTVRHGFYARWRGADYEASPDGAQVRLYLARPAEGFSAVAPDRHVRVVPAAEVDRLAYVNTFCTWRGEPFVVLGEHEDWLRLEYTGGKAPVAERLGLEPFDRGVYQAWAPRAEVEDLREEAV
ncbi:TY-Chap domain-containing protein [Spirillospora sp. CA-294931]|uniref:TY-Chap domain-containing protein n=1 Tax=Spirillospora sp. CA-294931 TaxID=3240042 RepID=UPI003D8DA7B8